MRTIAATVVLNAAFVAAGCGATRRVANSVTPGPTITSATVQFQNREHGKDARSAVDVWIVRNGSNEMAHLHSVNTEFDDHAAIAPMSVPLSGTFGQVDLSDAQLRIRLTPDGADDWSFEPRLTIVFSDNTSRTYAWPEVMLDQTHPEVALSFSSAVRNP